MQNTSSASDLQAWLHAIDPFPLLGHQFSASSYCSISLDRKNPVLAQYPTHTYEGLDKLVQDHLKEHDAQVAVGGYGEHRTLYDASPHFDGTRCIHLGIDLWAPAGTRIFAPLDGRVHSLAYNSGILDYGATLILEHATPAGQLYSLYGHIDRSSLSRWTSGDTVRAGVDLCAFGDRKENGGWVPHLHFQLMRDMEGKVGDYPGVCRPDEKSRYLANCLDPEWVFSIPKP